MRELSAEALRDIGVHTCDKIGRDIDDAMQLIDDPEQRATLAYNIAKALMAMTVDFTRAAFEAQSGHSMTRQIALYAIIKQMLQCEGIMCREVDEAG